MHPVRLAEHFAHYIDRAEHNSNVELHQELQASPNTDPLILLMNTVKHLVSRGVHPHIAMSAALQAHRERHVR